VLDVAELLLAAHAALAAFTALHALMHSRDPRAAWGWIAACWLAPILGPLLYLLLGVHRVSSRRARVARTRLLQPSPLPPVTHSLPKELEELVRIGDATTARALTPDNHVEVMHNGDEAYPAMLRAIDAAQRSIVLSTYIFRGDDTGRLFARLLGRAHRRGVQVRVLVDAVGDLYFWPRGSTCLRAEQVEVRRFQLGRSNLPLPHLNLRNHRKLLVIDDEVAFLGGLNIGNHHWMQGVQRPAVDMHFEVRGPVVAGLSGVFDDDWSTATGEPSRLIAASSAASVPADPMSCRVVTDGPLEEPSQLELILLGALANAHSRVSIVTPYFVPLTALSRALETAALRGVEVMLVLPARSNLPWVDWASRRWLESLLERGVKVRLHPDFLHTKMFVVDGFYTQIGSANLDARSLRLNFELNLEVYGVSLASRLEAHFDALCRESRVLELRDLRQVGALPRLRNALFWLFSAYF
jgi:cardiolipin synthase